MEWWLVLILIFGGVIALMGTSLPIAFCFLLVDLVGGFVLWRGSPGLVQVIYSLHSTISNFTLVPLPMFILMGEIMFRSAIVPQMIDAIDKWIGKIPGRLSLLTVASGTVFATLTGMSMSSVVMLGSVLVPEMKKRGYKKPMSIGPLLGAGPLAIMIPPSTMAILLGVIAKVSIGKILIAIIVPGLVLASFYTVYILARCRIQPDLAPPYDVPFCTLSEKVILTAKYVFPIAFIVFLVIGLILLGIATPTESAAMGAIGCIVLAAAYRKLTWKVLKTSIVESVYITVIMFMIIAGATAFSQILSFTGASSGMSQFAGGLPVAPVFKIVAMQIVIMVLGCFMDPVAIMMITLPVFMPIVNSLSFDPVWFAVLIMINLETAAITPPFGMALFAMKAVASEDTTMGDIYKASIPFVACDILVMALLIIFPAIGLWLPGLMRMAA